MFKNMISFFFYLLVTNKTMYYYRKVPFIAKIILIEDIQKGKFGPSDPTEKGLSYTFIVVEF